MFVEVKVSALALDEQSKAPILILKDLEEKRFLPIWIGALEAVAISMPLTEMEPPRPLTHDLMLTMLKELGASLEEVQITEIKDSTYYAQIVLWQNQESIVLDARPSDAIALALRDGARIVANENLLIDVSKLLDSEQLEVLKDNESKKWSEVLAEYDLDVSKYKM